MSRFVSAGTGEEPRPVDDKWNEAEQSIKESQFKPQQSGKQDDGRTLYEVLQSNKAAKQEAFEEASRLKNQFRALDEDEIDFLDSVLESTRSKDAAIRKETFEQLELFRKQQEESEKEAKAHDEDAGQENEEQWTRIGNKRKKAREKELMKGLKVRKTSSQGDERQAAKDVDKANFSESVKRAAIDEVQPSDGSKSPANPRPETLNSPKRTLLEERENELSAETANDAKDSSGLGLAMYGSSEED